MTELCEHDYAVVVGVDQNNVQNLALPTVAKDVQALRDVLVHPQRCAYKPEHVHSRPFPFDLPETKDIPAYEASPGSKAISDLLDGQERAILNSSTGTQKSYLRRDGQMSLLTYHLIEALSGHVPHAGDAKVVYVTDVMGRVTHEVKKSAARENRDQTPLMRTSGVFPVAQLIGGLGLAKGVAALRPEDPLPPVRTTVTFNQERQTVHGAQVNAGADAHIGQIGNKIITGGDYVGRNKVIHGDEVRGDKVLGDKVGGDKYSVGDNSDSSGVAIGPDASASVTTTTYLGNSAPDLAHLFAPLQIVVAQQNPALSGKVYELQVQITALPG